MPRPRSCARRSSSRRCGRSASCAIRRASAAGCARSRGGWPSTGRRGGRRRFSAEAGAFSPGFVDQDTPLVAVLARERAERVHAGLVGCAALDRDTLVAFYFRGQSLVEMSDRFQSPVGTIKRRLHVARKRLAKQSRRWPRPETKMAGPAAGRSCRREVYRSVTSPVPRPRRAASSSSWMMIRGVTIIIRLWVSRPCHVFEEAVEVRNLVQPPGTPASLPGLAEPLDAAHGGPCRRRGRSPWCSR